MNISILGVVPWRELVQSGASNSKLYVVSTFMQRAYGSASWAGPVVSVLIMWTAFASVFSLMLGYSRVPYAAAADGNYFRAFAKVHPVHKFPYVSLLALAGVAALFCFLRLADLIAALVVIRILVAVSGAEYRGDRVADTASGHAAPVSDVAVSGAGTGGGGSFIFILFSRKDFADARFGTLG